MLDLNNISAANDQIEVKPSDKIFIELGNNTYDFKDLISEFIDNSISAKPQDRILEASIHIYVDEVNNAPQRIIIKDNAAGIPKDRMALAITPAGIQTPESLNEHGLGMKQAIAGMGTLEYLATKTRDENSAIIIKEFKFGNIPCYLGQFDTDCGTEICIKDIKPIVNTNPQSITKTLITYLGARYRRFLTPDNPKMSLKIHLKNAINGNTLYTWNVEELKPIYFHPGERKNKPVISKKILEGAGWKAELTFGYAPTEDELEELGLGPLPRHHPYYVSLNKQGLDVLLHDRIILFHQLSELEIISARHPDYNSIRGEIVLLHGFRTAITKNSIIHDEKFIDCINQVKSLLAGNGDDSKKNYLKGRKYPEELPEDLLRDRLANWLQNNPLNKKNSVISEYTVQGLAGAIDILADGEAWELKRDQANGLDVYQLFAYMDMGDKNKGYLVAASFAPGAQAASEFIKNKHKKEIVLANLQDFPINQHPSQEERENYY